VANLLEDHRALNNHVLTAELKAEIDRKIEGFLSTVVRRPEDEGSLARKNRSKRQAQEPDQIEKGEFFVCFLIFLDFEVMFPSFEVRDPQKNTKN
jgi:hypothetical protein